VTALRIAEIVVDDLGGRRRLAVRQRDIGGRNALIHRCRLIRRINGTGRWLREVECLRVRTRKGRTVCSELLDANQTKLHRPVKQT
jgi:hypothetical protein